MASCVSTLQDDNCVNGVTIFQAIIDGIELVPKQRMTGRSRFLKRSQRYLQTKKALAWEMKKRNERKKPYEGKVILTCSIHLTHRRRVDLDNAVGAVMDALQYAGIIQDDRQVVAFTDCWLYQKSPKPRIAVKLQSLFS